MINVIKVKSAFTDERGSIFDIVQNTVGHVGLITSKKGVIRARHYHKKSTQYTFVLSGKVEFFEKDPRSKNPKIESVTLGPFDLVITPPMVIHAMKFLEDSVFLEMTSESKSGDGYEKDTVRVDLDI